MRDKHGRHRWRFFISLAVGAVCLSPMRLFGQAADSEVTRPAESDLRQAVDKSLPLLVAGAQGSMEQRQQCFTCHNQGLPILALTTAKTRGYSIDEEHLQAQLKFTAAFLAKNKSRYLEGKGQGGQADTAGYAIWTLASGAWPADDTTAAVAEYFLLFQKDSDHWTPVSNRPPSEASSFTTTYVSLRGLKSFGTADQQERIATKTGQVRDWLIGAEPRDTEDRVFHLRALDLAKAPTEAIAKAAQVLLKEQRADGGWAQLPDLDSDAYATGSALVALHESGGVATNESAYQRGLAFLLKNQLADGSWHVKSRSKPFQAYFESGYPHGKDQFISIAGGSWATTALLLALPKPTDNEARPVDP